MSLTLSTGPDAVRPAVPRPAEQATRAVAARSQSGATALADVIDLDATRVRRLTDAQRSHFTQHLLEQAAAAGGEEERRALLDRVVELNMRVAEALARRYDRKGMAIEDLTQVAYLALVRAVRSFDPGQGRDLLAYAVPSITGEIRRHFRDHGWTIRPPRDVQRAHSRLLRAQISFDRLDQAGVEGLAAEVEESVDTVREALAARSFYSLLSLDAPAPGAEDAGPRDVAPDGDRDAEQCEARMLLRPLLAQLAPREREVLALRFVHERSQREIAEELGMSQVQVSRLLQKLLVQLRQALGDVA
ncbi:sigma-70 family RNA polymerase sigma factor [Nocardioides sp. GY 10127]|uniref:sigma-70 family RNA polymerase sigma factor n=1 Tax=Nocardioides sp. GY 10127 TaxID=2569762 RepID=UPI0010A7D8BD|nr:sigma-70 family RNA polymerase sigma factor [Nocardioides sp. GY 10127]TIC81558.1 sigma-70 family RNA polymerase sigma factor [Nocardioides sp. GY 10127]